MSPLIGWAIVAIAFVLMLIYDGALVSAGRVSMSRYLMVSYRNRPYIIAGVCLLVGVLLGHLFWPLESCLELLK